MIVVSLIYLLMLLLATFDNPTFINVPVKFCFLQIVQLYVQGNAATLLCKHRGTGWLKVSLQRRLGKNEKTQYIPKNIIVCFRQNIVE